MLVSCNCYFPLDQGHQRYSLCTRISLWHPMIQPMSLSLNPCATRGVWSHSGTWAGPRWGHTGASKQGWSGEALHTYSTALFQGLAVCMTPSPACMQHKPWNVRKDFIIICTTQNLETSPIQSSWELSILAWSLVSICYDNIVIRSFLNLELRDAYTTITQNHLWLLPTIALVEVPVWYICEHLL